MFWSLLVAAAMTPSNSIDSARMRADVEKLSSWHDRNTNNDTLFEAANWIAEQYRKIPGLQVELMRYPVKKGARIKEDKEVVQVVATLPGATDRRIIVGGHFDTINMTSREPTSSWSLPSPGANDDASGVSVALELARTLSGQKWQQTLVFVAFSGEEQGLLGSTALAARATADGWKIDAVLSNDTVGSPANLNGQRDSHHIRLFSEEVPRGARNADGELVPHHDSRELARYIEWITRDKLKGFNVRLVFRADRFGRGGDHTPFNKLGFDAVRLVEPHEEYSRQHTTEDLSKYVDWTYLANVARINALAISTMAKAGDPPSNVRVDRSQGHDTRITWKGEGKFVVYWRETTSPVWQSSKSVGEVSEAQLLKISKDDNVFAVGAIGGVPVEAR